jgi:ABC-type branched-subunit amino acid transport system ATPase component
VSADTSGLLVCDLAVRYGGLTAVNGVSLHAPPGRITGFIGPNGAGKTSTFNALSGLLRPSAGSVALDGRDITHASPVTRAKLGLGRTFQRMELCDALTVRQNIALGREAQLAGSSPIRHLFGTRHERRDLDQRVEFAIELCGLGHLAGSLAGGLPTGQRRLIELARAVAGGFQILLLDEPSSGLDTRETARFGEILGELKRSAGVGILLVEHDMGLVMDICDHIYVIDFGQPIYDGTPEAVAASGEVRAAYLGDAVPGAAC